MERTEKAETLFQMAVHEAYERGHEYLYPEHLLYTLVGTIEGMDLVHGFGHTPDEVRQELVKYLNGLDCIPQHVLKKQGIELSCQMTSLVENSEFYATSAGRQKVGVTHMIQAILRLYDSMAQYILLSNTTDDEAELMSAVIAAYGADSDESIYGEQQELPSARETQDESWRSLVTCIDDQIDQHNPLIGREAELERTIQVLCRKDKNNPLHIGEPGVGKSALIYGLAAQIREGKVPERLRGAHIYQMDMASMVAGTSYRGDFEKRIKSVMEGVQREGNSIIYIDEIHSLVGTGTIGESTLDASNILKPYLEGGAIRFIGTTTYQEYNRHLRQNKGFVRRFQQIDIGEPSVEETLHIIEGLQEKYEAFHHVSYTPEALRHAVRAAELHIHDRYLPDKAIDLIDEAGAFRQTHPLMRKYHGELRRAKTQTVDVPLINDVVARICKMDPSTLDADDNSRLEHLSERISSAIYGQEEAVRQVVEAVQMGKAGLLEEGKPIASLLFVGPTGVGKTEVCKVLAQELGIELVRFDMSEYTEKHAVAKLIGTPAGYVGYDDGGLLTDAIRKSPHCVLLLDEIEKAHSDIYNILLQVMDYARLTDNKGNQADFRNVILVMTSNAGAQYAHQAAIGFGTANSAGSAMLDAVRKHFKPEFLARLSGTVVFNDMDRTMASLILDKKLRQLSTRLASRKVTLTLSVAAHDYLLDKGYSAKLGAREMDRQLNASLNPLLMREILFGSLRHGGAASVDCQGEKLVILPEK